MENIRRAAWEQLTASDAGRAVGAYTARFSAGGNNDNGRLSQSRRENDSGKLEYFGSGNTAPDYAEAQMGCFAMPAAAERWLRLHGPAIGVRPMYRVGTAQMVGAIVDRAPRATAMYGDAGKLLPVAPVAAADEAAVQAEEAGYMATIRAALDGWAASLEGQIAEAARLQAEAEEAEKASHPAPMPAPWYCFGDATPEQVVAAHPDLTPGIGVSPNRRGPGWAPELVQGDRALFALTIEGMRSVRYAVDEAQCRGVRILALEAGKGLLRVIAAVEPGFAFVATGCRRGGEPQLWTWTAAGEADFSDSKPSLGTFADLLRR